MNVVLGGVQIEIVLFVQIRSQKNLPKKLKSADVKSAVVRISIWGKFIYVRNKRITKKSFSACRNLVTAF